MQSCAQTERLLEAVSVTVLLVSKKIRHVFVEANSVPTSQSSGAREPLKSTPSTSLVTTPRAEQPNLPPHLTVTTSSESPGGAQVSVTAPSTEYVTDSFSLKTPFETLHGEPSSASRLPPPEPGGPAGPSGPVGPRAPGSPFGPVGPAAPFAPGSPLAPCRP